MHQNNEKQVQERLLQLKEFLSNAKLRQTAIFRRLQNSLVEFEADLACTQSETTSMVEEVLMLFGETGNAGSVPFVSKNDALLKSAELPVVALTGEEASLWQKVQALNQIAVNNNAGPSSPKLGVTDRCAEEGATFRNLVDFMKEPLCQSGQTSLNDTYTVSSQKMDSTNCREKQRTELFEKIVEVVEPFDHQTAPSKSEADGQEVKTSLKEMVKAQLEKKNSCNSAYDATFVLSPKFDDEHADRQENKLKKAVAEHMAAAYERNGERVPSVSVASAGGDEQRGAVPPPENEAENFGQTRTTSATSIANVEENIVEVEDDDHQKQNEEMPQTEGAVDGLRKQKKGLLDIDLLRSTLFQPVVVTFTGLSKDSREDLGAMIRKMGGRVWSAVDQKFTHLIAVKCDINSDKY
uniref:BRCT domain-containing protein n=1 Tax=Globodera pallida TaxID=36090 RepID=A0A183C9B7_GLOPA